MGIGRRVPVGPQRNILGVPKQRPSHITLVVRDHLVLPALSLSLLGFRFYLFILMFVTLNDQSTKSMLCILCFCYFCSTVECYLYMLGFRVCPFCPIVRTHMWMLGFLNFFFKNFTVGFACAVSAILDISHYFYEGKKKKERNLFIVFIF